VTPLLLFPGSGSGADHPSLLAVQHAVGRRRCTLTDFPYRLAGRRVPDRAPVLMQAVRDAARPLLRRRKGLVLGGRSMGGRMCSMVVADPDDPLPATALVLIAYPLHPPGAPDRLRTEHFPNLHVPCLFVSGTNDRFGSPDELRHWTDTIPGPVTHVWMEGKGHDLRGCDAAVAQAVAEWVSAL
jgi:predicted alpha/beta-hydrolase family hydrolase